MNNRKRSLSTVATLALLAACGGRVEELTPATVVEEIPVTTSSPAALADFEAGRTALDAGRPQRANELLRSAAAKDPGFAAAYLYTAKSAASAQEFKEQLELAAAHLDGKSEGERLLVEIYRTFLRNDAARRIELARTLTESYPRSPRAWLTLGYMQGGLNRNEAARESFGKALELDSQLLAARVALGYNYLFNEPRDFEAARRQMEKGIELAPGEAKMHENLGDAYRALKDLDAALAAYARAAEMDPGLSAASIKQGHVNSFLGNFEAARAAYDAGVAGARGRYRADYANYRAFTHLHAGDPQAALDELAQLLASLDGMQLPEDQRAGVAISNLTDQATIALHHGFFDAAEKILAERAAVMRADAESIADADFSRLQEADVLLWEGRLAARRGDAETARALAEESRALIAGDANPRRFEGYHGLLGLIELLAGDPRLAIEHFEQANLTDVYVKYHLALARVAAGEVEAARRLFREVAEWNFNTVEYALVRNDALARSA